MLAALVLICSVAITPDLRDCTRANATVVMRVPADFGNPVTCFMHGQAYLAQTTMGQALGEDERVKGRLPARRNDRRVDPPAGSQVAVPARGRHTDMERLCVTHPSRSCFCPSWSFGAYFF